MFDKIWKRQVIQQRDGGTSLLYIDCHIVHYGSFHTDGQLHQRNLKIRRPADATRPGRHNGPI